VSEFIDSPDLMFPRKRKPEKTRAPMKRSQLKANPKKYKGGSVPEERLQNFADKEALLLGFDTNHIPQSMYRFLISDSLVIDEELKSFLKKQFFGRPDCEIRANIPNTPYQMILQAELKTDSEFASLTPKQKEYLRHTNFELLTSKDQISQSFKKFSVYLGND